VLSKGARRCIFCEPAEPINTIEDSSATLGNVVLNVVSEAEWRGELNQRVQAYRARRRKPGSCEAQTELPFVGPERRIAEPIGVRAEESTSDQKLATDDFAFTIAIGRPAKKRQLEIDTKYFIDVSLPPEEMEESGATIRETALPEPTGLYPAATLDERRSAGLIDAGCLAFAYGAFLTLFGSLGGHFAFSKLNAAVYFFTFAFVYLQYFGLFTIFGSTTPGMMIRGLQVATFTGEEPTLRHLLMRALGYLLSAGTLFLGFLWALWDEDALTWHDRLSKTYLRAQEMLADLEETQAATSR
jgi:uncharacterized RDD family membrane protein YckC